MAIKELFQDNRPEVFFDPRASRRIDPRFKYTRNSTASYTDNFGLLRPNAASAGQPRYNYDSDTKEYLGLLLEPSRTNVVAHSGDVSQWTLSTNMTATGNSITLPTGESSTSVEYAGTDTTPNAKILRCALIDGQSTISAGDTKTFSVFLRAGTENNVYVVLQNASATEGTGSLFNLSTGAFVGTQTQIGGTSVARQATKLANGWYRVSLTCTFPSASVGMQAFMRLQANSNTVTATTSFSAWGSQVEAGLDPTSYIPTTTSAVTRAADILTIDTNLPSSGTILVDSRAAQANDGNVITSLANASNQKLNLALQSLAATYNSLALVASYSGTTKTSLPLPVPTSSRERNIVTWGTQNYQYGQSFSRFAQSLASSVPANMNRLSIGSDAVDPIKAFNGHVNRLYIWAGEMAPAVAEALVRGELDPINADTYSPTGPAGSLSLIVNTQGAGSDGNKIFTLPANRASTAATALVTGQTYRILTTGTSNFTLVGAASNTVGTVFVATGTTTGTGTAAWHNDIVVTWGDGTESGLEGAAAEVGAVGLAHTYPSAGIYPVWVEGRMQNIYYNNIADAADLVRIETWGTGDMFRKPSTMNGAFYGCSKMDFSATARTTNIPDTSAVTDWTSAFRGCASITGTFPQFNYSAATTLSSAFYGCSSITAWPDVSTQTQNVTILANAWRECSSLASFPLINTSKVTSFVSTWHTCTSLASFPLIDTALGTDFSSAWYNCSSLTSFPLVNTVKGVNFLNTWRECSGLTSFPLINTSAGTIFSFAWYGCSSLSAFPAINTALGTNFSAAWQGCTGLTAFPALSLNAATGLASDVSSSYTGFRDTWRSCTALATFPANMFNSTVATRFADAWTSCALTAQSIENILVSINTANTSNGILGIGGGTNAAKSTWTANANTAYDALIGRGWTITFNA